MLMNRTSLLTLAAIAALAVAGSTAAQAGGRSFAPQFGHRGVGIPVMACIPLAQRRVAGKVVVVRQKDDEPYTKPANRPRPAAEPVKSTSVANAAASTPAAAATSTCLTKEYLDTGAVLFKDTCTKEWAINSTHVDYKGSTVGRTCLIKEGPQNGVVMFKDTCTNEWAMNTVDQQAQTAQAR